MSIDTTLDSTVNSVAIPHKRGIRYNTSNIHSKSQSGIAMRLKLAGVNWIESFGVAIKNNDKELLTLWLRLLPYLVVTGSHKRAKRFKGRASKAALAALSELENE